MRIFLTLFIKESTEIFRSKKLLILCIVFGFVAISSPIIAKIIPDIFKNINTNGIIFNIPDPTWKDAIDQFVKNTSQFGLIVVLFMFAGAIADEKSKKTLEMLLTKPISRTAYIFSKFFAGAFYISTIFSLSGVVFYSYANSLFGDFDLVNFILLMLFLLIFLLTIFAITLFFSTISNSQIKAAGLAFVISIVFTSVLGYIKAISDYSPSYIISNYKDLMTTGNLDQFLPSLYTSLALIIALVTLSISLFSKQEIER
jgi:ABC-2 type transport system permease protein